jgi:3-oxoadipate enol-lactonase
MHYTGKNIPIKVNELTISYNDYGPENAPVIIFIHGFPLNKSMWDTQLDELKKYYRVIAYDIRGHGNSETGHGEFSIDIFVHELISLMNILQLDKVSLCGLSMGGYIALRAVEEFPDRFEALILSDTQCIADSTEAKAKRMMTIEKIKQHGVEKYADESIKNLFAAESFSTKKEEIAAVREMIVNTSGKSIFNTLHALAERKETCSRLQDINIPVLIMVGKEDKITPPDAARLMHEKIQHAAICIIEHAGHLSNMENPEEFNYQMKIFLKNNIKITTRLFVFNNN